MKLTNAALSLVLLAGISPAGALAWGNDGHKIVCEIAFQNLTPEAKLMTDGLVRGSGYQSFSESCTWADKVRRDRRETAGWHFVNVPPDQRAVAFNRDCGPPRRCAIWAIRGSHQTLANRSSSPKKRREALFFVSHFVGDIHQPLHVSHSRDRGGNSLNVNFLGRKTNLHTVWDSRILVAAGFRSRGGVARLLRITPWQRRGWSTYDLVGWANESLFRARRFAYRDVGGREIKTGHQLGGTYLRRRKGVVGLGLQQGGVRLAFLLNEAASGGTFR